jgi:hypothetical protein
MFAYPCGGERGTSGLTLLLFTAGAALLWRARKRVVLLTLLAPFGLGIAAAALKRYPYGGVADGSPARVMQYLAPSICLLAGIGFAGLLAVLGDRRPRLRVLPLALVLLAVVGAIPLAAEAFHPYRSIHAQRAREFARRFWPDVARGAEPVCLRWDLGVGEWNSTNLNVPVYLCNQMIYSPVRRRQRELQWEHVAADRPLRCVLSLCDPNERRVAAWLAAMKQIYQLKECRELTVDVGGSRAKPRTERYVVYEFVAKAATAADRETDIAELQRALAR